MAYDEAPRWLATLRPTPSRRVTHGLDSGLSQRDRHLALLTAEAAVGLHPFR